MRTRRLQLPRHYCLSDQQETPIMATKIIFGSLLSSRITPLTFLVGRLSGCDAMRSSWRRNLGNVRSFVSNSMGGLRGGSNIASWVVAGTLAYFLWVKPAKDLKREQEERAALAAADPNRYIEKRKPMADPQQTGLIYGGRRNINTDKKEG